jgi:hypothetical protein
MTAVSPGGPEQAPLLEFPRGNPGTTEIAVVVAVLAALPGPAPGDQPQAVTCSQWPARSRLMREPLRRGPGAWRASALPR